MKSLPVIEGKLVRLAQFSPEYITLYHTWMQDKYVLSMIGEDDDFSFDDVVKLRDDWENSTYVAHFLVFDKSSSKPIGDVDLRDIKFGESAVSGIMIADPMFRSKGYGAEAYKLLLDFGFKNFNLKKVIAYVFSSNSPAITFHKKLGFSEVGRIDGDIVFELVTTY